jgi:hypothetical protein
VRDLRGKDGGRPGLVVHEGDLAKGLATLEFFDDFPVRIIILNEEFSRNNNYKPLLQLWVRLAEFVIADRHWFFLGN